MLIPTERLLLLVYSAVLIASLGMMLSVGRLAYTEGKRAGWKALRQNVYFVITAALVFQSAALTGISGFRLYDGLTGFHIGGRWPQEFTIFMSMLWASKTAFHWAATLDRPRWEWRLFVMVTLLDLALLSSWLWMIY